MPPQPARWLRGRWWESCGEEFPNIIVGAGQGELNPAGEDNGVHEICLELQVARGYSWGNSFPLTDSIIQILYVGPGWLNSGPMVPLASGGPKTLRYIPAETGKHGMDAMLVENRSGPG